MMVNDRLIERIESEGRGPGFSQLRNWLYWDFIQELLKICDDTDHRAPSIRQLKRELDDTETLRILKEKYSRRIWPHIHGEKRQIAQYFQKREEFELGSAFDDTYRRFKHNSAELLASKALAGYRTIRHKLIAHNELRKSIAGYTFLDLKDLKLKYGQERKLLEMTQSVVDDLDLLVRNSFFVWDSFFEQEKKKVCKFWEIETIE